MDRCEVEISSAAFGFSSCTLSVFCELDAISAYIIGYIHLICILICKIHFVHFVRKLIDYLDETKTKIVTEEKEKSVRVRKRASMHSQ